MFVADKSYDKPLVSVAVSTYNRENYLRESLTSVLRQDYPNVEILVMDDGSTDGTASAVAEFPGVVYLRQENQGPAVARNELLKRVNGKYVLFFDDDDLMDSNALSQLVAAAEAAGPGSGAYAKYRRINSAGERLSTRYKLRDYPSGNIIRTLFCANILLPSATLLPVDAMRRLKRWFDRSRHVCEDYEVFLELAIDTPFALVDAPLVSRRRHRGNLSARTPENTRCEFMVLCDFLTRHPGLIPPDTANRRLALILHRESSELRHQGRCAEGRDVLRESFRYAFSFKMALRYCLNFFLPTRSGGR